MFEKESLDLLVCFHSSTGDLLDSTIKRKIFASVINIPEEICFSTTRWNIQTTEENQWYQTALNCKLKPIFMEGKFSSTVQVTFFESFCWVGPYAQTKFRKKNVIFNTTIFYCLFRCYSKWEVRGFLAHVYGWQYPFL